MSAITPSRRSEGNGWSLTLSLAAGSLLWLSWLMAGGCLGYRVGGHLPPGIASVYVIPVENESGEPQLEAATRNAIIERFQSDGRLIIADAETADAHVEVRITGSDTQPLRYDREAAVTATEYRLTLFAETTLVRRDDGTLVLDRHPVEGWVEFRGEGNFPDERRAALPEAARELGRQVVRAIVEYW